jgi:ABC-type multidrug transport system permease subunit
MSALTKLFLGEMKRMVSYKILPISIATSLIWVVLFALLSAAEAQRFAPLLLYMDAGVMSLLLAGAFHHLERTDGTAKTMLVLPVSTGQIILSKALAAAALGLVSALVISLALFFLHGIVLRYLALALVVAAAAMAHAAAGLVIALKSRDFSGTLGGIMLFILLLFVPAILLEMGVIPRGLTWLVMLSPSAAATEALNYASKTTSDLFKAAAGLVYLAALAFLLYRFPVLRLFRRHASVG